MFGLFLKYVLAGTLEEEGADEHRAVITEPEL